MKYCIKCGAALNDAQNFCNYCGAWNGAENTPGANNGTGYNSGSYNGNVYNNGYNNGGYNNGFGSGIIPRTMSKDMITILISSIISIISVVFIPFANSYGFFATSFIDALEWGEVEAMWPWLFMLIPLVMILIGAIKKSKKIVRIGSIIGILVILFIAGLFATESEIDTDFGFWIAAIGIIVSLVFSIKK